MTERHKFMTGMLVILIAVAIGAWQWSNLQGIKFDTARLNADVSNLSAIKNAEVAANQGLKSEVNAMRATSGEELTAVFPTDEDITALTRLFDEFAVKNNYPNNPFFISNISYDTRINEEEGGYRSVNFSVSLTASRKNLDKFVEFIETSGSLESGVRLMSVEDMRIVYPIETDYSAELTLKAYFSQEIK